jgi:predicted RNase H-like HicB family nuclease
MSHMSPAGQIDFTALIWQEGNQFIAHAMPLDVMSAGQTPDAARQALNEAVSLFLATATDIGTLKEVLLETGYELRDGTWVSPSWIALERHSAAVGT